jgi:hypothetical protein
MQDAPAALVGAPDFWYTARSVRRLLREPLVHFVAIGAALFLLFAWTGSGGAPRDRIVVTRARVAALTASFQLTWQRPPTPEELKGLVDAWVREEAAVREAAATGLDRDDPVVRRRLQQKVEALAADRADPPPADPAAAADAKKREIDALYERLLSKPQVVVETAPEKK